ncbi:MAG: nuclear transport factor 2 family protein [Rubrobacteraceae bacterium]|nr:nuclear transport factor 2 family protein [Rubrobacteraceae bacterium]
MSQENVEIYRTNIEDVIAGEFDHEAAISRMAELWDPQIELDASEAPALDLSRVCRGSETVRQWWREWFGAWEALQVEYELVDAGDRVVFLLDMRVRGRSSGIDVAFGKHAWVTTFRAGLMVHNKLYMSQSEALEAVGLRE